MRYLVVGILLLTRAREIYNYYSSLNKLFFPSRNRTELRTTIINIKYIEKEKL